MGRPRLPTQDKITRGNPGKRALNRMEPDPEYLDDLTPPTWLPEIARPVWIEFAPAMRKAKVLTVIDVPAFAKWCVKEAMWRTAINDLLRLGVMVERIGRDGERVITKRDDEKKSAGKSGGKDKKKDAPALVVNQLVFVESMFFKQAVAIEREFGMTPAARTRVQVDPQLTLFPNDGRDDLGAGQKSKGAAYFTSGETSATH